TVSHRRFANMTAAAAARLKHEAADRIAAAERALIGGGIESEIVDGHIRVTDDAPKQTAIEAGRYRSDLILAEMPGAGTPLSYAHPVEELMRIAPTDVAAYRSVGT